MGFWQGVFGIKSDYDAEVKRISSMLILKGITQSHELKINAIQETDKLATQCGLSSTSPIKKQCHPAYFMDVVLRILCYPPELAYIIALGLSKYEICLGFKPFGTIMVALGQVRSLNSGCIKASEFDENPGLFEIFYNDELRTRKAGEMLAKSFFMHSKCLKDVRKLCHSNPYDVEVKCVIDSEIQKIAGVDLTDAILS